MSDPDNQPRMTLEQALEAAEQLGKQAQQLHGEATHWRVIAAVLAWRAGGTVTITEEDIDVVSKMEVKEHLLKAQEGGNGDGDRLEVTVQRVHKDIGMEVVRSPKIQAEVSALDLLSQPEIWEDEDE